MAHLLIIELPGGNDTDIIQAALARGDEVTFLTSRLALYQAQPQVWAVLRLVKRHVELPPGAWNEAPAHMLQLHRNEAIDAVLCLIDIRLTDASRIASALGLNFLNPDSAHLVRNKYLVRQRLHEAGIEQPAFRLACSNRALQQAVDDLGLPVLVKPTDGYGSINVLALRHSDDLHPLLSPLEDMLPSRTDYGLGVMANEQLLVERCMTGQVIGCDTFSHEGKHTLLGINEKLFFDAPSFAIRGGCFTPGPGDDPAIARYVQAVLDAVGFDWGAAHVELMLTDEGPRLIEINARLVGAKIPRLLSLALHRDVHQDLIALHLGDWQPPAGPPPTGVAVSRWQVSDCDGELMEVILPETMDTRAVRGYEIVKQPGDRVRPPLENADRIGYVMTTGENRTQAEAAAEAFVSALQLRVRV